MSILLVDDETRLRQAIARSLTAHGHRVEEAATCQEAMNRPAEAVKSYESLIKQYPTSPYAAQAKEKLLVARKKSAGVGFLNAQAATKRRKAGSNLSGPSTCSRRRTIPSAVLK